MDDFTTIYVSIWLICGILILVNLISYFQTGFQLINALLLIPAILLLSILSEMSDSCTKGEENEN